MDYLVPALAVVAMVLMLGVGWVLTLFCMPGTWVIVAGTAAYAYLIPDDWRVDIGWTVVGVVLALAVLGEVIESLTVAVGAKRAGGSKRAAILALCGSIAGGLAGGLLGVPIPVVGSVIAAVFGAAFGATAGAMLGEHWKGRTSDESWEVGKAAFWGRLLGTVGKIIVASMIVAVVLVALAF